MQPQKTQKVLHKTNSGSELVEYTVCDTLPYRTETQFVYEITIGFKAYTIGTVVLADYHDSSPTVSVEMSARLVVLVTPKEQQDEILHLVGIASAEAQKKIQWAMRQLNFAPLA